MPRESRVKRARTIAAALSSAGIESTQGTLPTTGPSSTQPLTTQPLPIQADISHPLPNHTQSSQLPPSPHTAGSSVGENIMTL